MTTKELKELLKVKHVKRRVPVKEVRPIESWGKCIVCGRMTSDMHYFTDDPEDTVGYLDYCCDECFEYLLERL
jgi:hypothetical protein